MEVLEALNIQTAPQPTPVLAVSPVSKTPPQFDKTRRQILTLGGLAGGGFLAAMLTERFVEWKVFRKYFYF